MSEAERAKQTPDPLAAAMQRIAHLEKELAAARTQADSEHRYQALVRATAQAVWNSNANGFGTEAWEWWESLTGQTKEQGQLWGWLEVVHPDDRERARAAWQNAQETLSDYDSEFRVRSRNGDWRHIRSRGVPLLDKHGRLVEWVGVFIDETDRYDLAGGHERFHTIFHLSAVGVAEGSIPDGRFVAVNRRMVELTGYSEAELLQRTFLDITHPDDRPQNAAAFESLLRGEIPSYTYEKRYIHKDGREVWVESHVSLLRDPEGKPLRSIGIIKDRSALYKAREAMRQSTARLKLVADSIPALISYIDRDYRYRLANKEYENWFRIPAEQIEGRTVPEVLGDEAFAHLKKSMDRALSGERVQYEGWAPYSSGSRYIRATYIPDLVSDQQVEGFAVLVEDLTQERRAAELAASLNEQLQHRVRDFEELFQAMPIPVAIARDAEARDIRVNRAFAEILGVDPGEQNVSASNEAIQRPFRFFGGGIEIPAEDLPQQKAQREGHPVEGVELEVVRENERRWSLYGSAVPLFDEQGRVRGSIAAFIDVTERKRADQAVRDSERRLTRLIETSPFGIAIGTFQGSVLYANDSFLNTTGYTREDLQSGLLNWVTMTPPEWLPLDARGASELRQRGFATPFEKEYIRKDGSRVPILMGACLLNEPFAEAEQIVGFYLDLTQRKHAETELQASNDELRRINLDLEQFAYAAAHDLQEPLRMVSLYTQLFARRYSGQIDAAADLMMRQLIASSTRAQALVADLLTYTRVIHGEAQDADLLDCGQVMREVISNLSASIQEAGATVTCDELPMLRISRSHMMQLLQNLVSNALKYARSGVPPQIRVTSRKVDSDYHIRVEDNGTGIKPEYQERIFGIFKRLHGQDVPGTGIGLAICRRIVERYRGQIWVESDGEGCGAAFVFKLPGS